MQGREREARFPNQRYVGSGGGLVGGGDLSGDGQTAYRTAATVSDAFPLHYPLNLCLVAAPDSTRPLGYLLESESKGFRPLQTITISNPNQKLFCTDTAGHQARAVSLQEILNMRTKGESFYLEGYSSDCERDEQHRMPPQSVINLRYYIYDHLGNTRVMYSTSLGGCVLSYTVEFVGDYSPYGRLLRSYSGEKYLTTTNERDVETGYDDRGARMSDCETMRFLTTDSRKDKHPGWSGFGYVMGNPVNLIDPYGEDTIYINRTNRSSTLSDEFTNVWEVTITLVQNGVVTQLDLGGKTKFYMFGTKQNDANGDNAMEKKDNYVLKYDLMSEHPSWVNAIRANGPVFIHNARDMRWLRGCKGICSEYQIGGEGNIYEGTPIFAAKDNVETLQKLRELYDQYKDQLTGDKFIMKNTREEPNAFPLGKSLLQNQATDSNATQNENIGN